MKRLNFLLLFLFMVSFFSTLAMGNEFEFASADQAVSTGKAYLAKKEYASGEECFRKAVEIDPLCSDAWGLLGESMIAGKNSYRIDESDEEIPQCLQKAISLDPKNHGAFSSLGTFYLYLGDYENAEKYYQKALNLKSDLVYISNLAMVFYLNGNKSASEKLRKLGCDTYPTNFNIHLDYVEQMFSSSKYLEALPYYKRLTVLSEGHPEKEELVIKIYDRAKERESKSIISRFSKTFQMLKWQRK